MTERVHLLGLRDDVEQVLNAADVFVHPSRSEGLPLAVLEAMGHRLPIVATGVGGIPEAIEDQHTGRLVQPEDPAALATAIAEILTSSDLRERLGQNARARAEAEFSIDSMIDHYLKLYRTTSHR